MLIHDIKDPKQTRFAYEGGYMPKATKLMLYKWHWHVLDLTKRDVRRHP